MSRSGETEFEVKESPDQFPTSKWIATRAISVKSLDRVLKPLFLLQITWCCKSIFKACLKEVLLKYQKKLSLTEKVAGPCIWKQAMDHLILPLSIGAPLYSSILLQLFVALDVACPVCMFYSELCVWLNVCVWLWIISLILHFLSSLTQVKQCHRCEKNFLETGDSAGVHIYIWKCNLWPVSQF